MNLVVRLAIVASIIACLAMIVVTQSDLAEKQDELAQIHAQTEALEAENVELSRILENDDLDAYMEKIAIEREGYAYPNERRFYDTSRN